MFVCLFKGGLFVLHTCLTIQIRIYRVPVGPTQWLLLKILITPLRQGKTISLYSRQDFLENFGSPCLLILLIWNRLSSVAFSKLVATLFLLWIITRIHYKKLQFHCPEIKSGALSHPNLTSELHYLHITCQSVQQIHGQESDNSNGASEGQIKP